MRNSGITGMMRVSRRMAVLGTGLLVVLGLFLATAGRSLAALPEDPFAGLQPMSAADLSAHRGGFVTPSGLEINLGAHVRSTFDGEVVLETLVSFTPKGIEKKHSMPNLGNVAGGLPPGLSIRLDNSKGKQVVSVQQNSTEDNGTADGSTGADSGITITRSQSGGSAASSSGGSGGGGDAVASSSSQTGEITSAGTTTGGSLTVPDGFEGAVQEVDGGVLAALHQIDPENGRIGNLVAATAANHSVEQTLTLTMEISGWQDFQSALSANRLGSQLRRDFRAANIDALGD